MTRSASLRLPFLESSSDLHLVSACSSFARFPPDLHHDGWRSVLLDSTSPARLGTDHSHLWTAL
ncbi:hypothetical protein GS506_15220 [Rhodococcus hoagii]|nr:hypothetical protein [Prescottella equi]